MEKVFSYRKTVSRTGLCLFLLAVTLFLAQIVLVALSLPWMGQPWYLGVVGAVGTCAVGVPMLFLYVRLLLPHPATNPPKAAKGALSLPAFGCFLLLGLGGMWALNYFSYGLLWGIGFLTGTSIANPVELAIAQMEPLVAVLLFCVCAPVAEELMFRKALYRCIGRFGDKAYIVISAVAFGLFHFNLSQLFYAVWIGLLLAYLYARTGRIWHSIALHMGINLVGGVLVPLLLQSRPGALVLYCVMGLCMLGTALLLPRVWAGQRLVPPAAPLPENPVRNAFLNIGAGLYVALSAGMIVVALVSAAVAGGAA